MRCGSDILSMTHAVSKLKEQVEKAPTLAYINPVKPVVIKTDASLTGIASCLLQDERPIAFTSHSLTDAKTRYAQIEKELLAIVYAFALHHGHQTTVHSDHKPLEAIQRKQINTILPTRFREPACQQRTTTPISDVGTDDDNVYLIHEVGRRGQLYNSRRFNSTVSYSIYLE